MESLFARRLSRWKKRRDIARLNEHLLWLKENHEFVRLQIPRYEAQLLRLQAQLFLMEPAPLQLQPPPSHARPWELVGAQASLLMEAVIRCWRRWARRAMAVMRRSGLPPSHVGANWR